MCDGDEVEGKGVSGGIPAKVNEAKGIEEEEEEEEEEEDLGSFIKRSCRLMAKDTLLIVYGDAFKVRLEVPLVGALIKRCLLLNRECEIKKPNFGHRNPELLSHTETLSPHTTPPPANRNPQLSHTTTSHDDRPPSTATLGLHRPIAAATTFFTVSLSLILTLTPATTTLGSQRASYAPSSRRRVPSHRHHSGAVAASSLRSPP
ncbi:hypothetical protein PIB30_086424 [Stylosanthes scabra]|uniref:Uncharacterized protein n=1 Tax=Stylosanthes scabra TaxID=79078 RepID=A0ABU6STE9_9FABA|nr:hypothetical protein [Stylosanthes scabra]